MKHKAKGSSKSMTNHAELDAAKLAQLFHESYELLAPSFGYETRKESAVPWSDVPDKNKRLMVAVAERIITASLLPVVERRESQFTAMVEEMLAGMDACKDVPESLLTKFTEIASRGRGALARHDAELRDRLLDEVPNWTDVPDQQDFIDTIDALRADLATARAEQGALVAKWKSEGKRCYDLAHDHGRAGKPDESLMAQSVRFWMCADELNSIAARQAHALALLEEAEWWAARTGIHNLAEGTEQAQRLASLKSQIEKARKEV